MEKLKEEKETYATLILQRAVLVVIARQKYEFLKAEKKRREEEERRKREEEERKRKQEEEKRRKDQEEERRKREEEERKRKQEEEKRRKDQEEERKRNQEELERKELEKKHKEEEIFKSGERNWEISHWWYGSITREEAEAMLKGLKGYSLFVVRETVAKGKLAISAVNREKKGNHFLIHWRISHENGKFSFEECPEETAVYSSLQELIMKTPLLDRYQPLGKFKN